MAQGHETRREESAKALDPVASGEETEPEKRPVVCGMRLVTRSKIWAKNSLKWRGEELGWKGFKEKVEFWGVDTTFKALGSHRNERRKFGLRGNKFKKCFLYSISVESPTELRTRGSTWSHKKGTQSPSVGLQPNTAVVISKENRAGGPESCTMYYHLGAFLWGRVGRRDQQSHLF